MQIELKYNHGLIQTLDGQAVAVLDKDSFRALSSCMAAQGHRIEVWVLEAEWGKKATKVQMLQTSSRKIVLMKVDLLLFGHRDAGDQVAAALGSFQHFLQPPNKGMSDCPHENPQSLQVPDPRPGMREADRALPAALRVEESDELDDHIDRPRDGNATQLANLITDIDALFDQLPAHRSIAMASRDSRILSSLFQYFLHLVLCWRIAHG